MNIKVLNDLKILNSYGMKFINKPFKIFGVCLFTNNYLDDFVFIFRSIEEFDIDEEESTISILNRYIDESEFEFDKNVIKGIFQDLYRQACEVE